MLNGLFQTCYTNHCREIDGQLVSGWQSVAVSPGIPEDALRRLTSFQVPLSQITGGATDENGRILCLREVIAESGYVYFIRSKFGLQDRMGRANMFSHGYVFSADAVLEDPNVLLTLGTENFRESAEEAEAVFEKTVLPAFTLRGAMGNLGLTEENLRKLLHVAYYQATDRGKRDEPLYVQYDGSDLSIRSILYLLYSLLPLSIVKRYKAGTFGTVGTIGKNLIFSEKAWEKASYIDPKTGQNNVLTERIEKKITRALFVDEPLKYLDDEAQCLRFRKELLETARTLGDSTGENEAVLRLSMALRNPKDPSDLTENELLNGLSDALRTRTSGNETVDRYIAGLFTEIVMREVPMTEQNEDDLYARLPETTVPELKTGVLKYAEAKIRRMDLNEAVNEYAMLSPFNRKALLSVFAESPVAMSAPDVYYAEKFWETEEVTWETLYRVAGEIEELPVNGEATAVLKEKAQDYLLKSFKKDRRPENGLNEYVRLMKEGFRETDTLALRDKEIRVFWENLTYFRYNELLPETIQIFSEKPEAVPEKFKTYGEMRVMVKEARFDALFDAFSRLSGENASNTQADPENLRKALFQGLQDAEDRYEEYVESLKPKKKGFFSIFKRN